MTPSSSEHGTLADQPPPDQRVVARSREHFLTSRGAEPEGVRSRILASWKRSRQLKVAADHVEMHYERESDLDTPLVQMAHPVLARLQEQLDGQPLSVILTDPTGLILSRTTGDRKLERHLDRVLLAPGFSYAERYVGTNGIGTALEVGGPTHVFGHEHYAENLEDLACAGVPVRHPVTGRLAGVLDLTCWRKDAGALLLALARTTTQQVREALLADAGDAHLRLFNEYLRACHRRSGIVMAISAEAMMMNEQAHAVLDPQDQAVLMTQAVASLTREDCDTVRVDLPSGAGARMGFRPVREHGRMLGLVAQVTLTATSRTAATGTPAAAPLPGLVGHGPTWVQSCRAVQSAVRSQSWVVLEGEPGVGKLALLRAVHETRRPRGRLDVFDPAVDAGVGDFLRTAAATPGTVVLRHVDSLDTAQLGELKQALDSEVVADSERWIALTRAQHPTSQVPPAQRDPDHAAALDAVLEHFPLSVELPPLRRHLEDLPALVELLVPRLVHQGRVVCAPETVRMLMRLTWPGNVTQLRHVLSEAVKHRRSGTITPEDLPPEAHALSRRVLSALEAVERDVIVEYLRDAGGDKAAAARRLGMSRSTIYRKIHDYGILSQDATY